MQFVTTVAQGLRSAHVRVKTFDLLSAHLGPMLRSRFGLVNLWNTLKKPLYFIRISALCALLARSKPRSRVSTAVNAHLALDPTP